MTDRDLMQQALAALEVVTPYTDSLICYASTIEEHPPNAIDGKVSAAITALREKLAQQEQYERANPLGGPAKVFYAIGDAICAGDDYHTTLQRFGYAEVRPQQEPVAWGYVDRHGQIIDCITPQEHARVEGRYTVPLYTAPHLIEQAFDSIDALEMALDQAVEALAVNQANWPEKDAALAAARKILGGKHD